MSNEWLQLIKYLENKGKTPQDVKMIVYFYDLMLENHKLIKEYIQDEAK